MYDTYLSEQRAAQRANEARQTLERRRRNRLTDAPVKPNARSNTKFSTRHVVRLGRLVVMW